MHTTITWHEWSDVAFARASTERKPVLLALGVSWSRACLEMDRTSYADPGVVAIVGERFVPVRVDASLRPDVDERYNLGGWPTTAFLTPDGEILGGGTFVAAERLLAALRHVTDALAERGDEIDRLARDARARREAARLDAEGAARGLDVELVDRLGADLLETLREGDAAAAAQPVTADALALALELFRADRGDGWRHALRAGLAAAAARGLWDRAAGGVVRVVTREGADTDAVTLLADQAAWLPVLAGASNALEEPRYRDLAAGVVRFVRERLAAPEGGFLHARPLSDDMPAASQLLADANAAMAGACIKSAETIGEPGLLELALAALDRVLVAGYEPGGGVPHVVAPEPGVRGLLADQIRMAGAQIEAALATGREVHRDLAEELVLYALRAMWDRRGGGFFDREAGGTTEVGLLAEPVKPFALNCEAARVLARLAAITEKPEYLERAAEGLASQTACARSAGLDAAPYALALRELGLPAQP